MNATRSRLASLAGVVVLAASVPVVALGTSAAPVRADGIGFPTVPPYSIPAAPPHNIAFSPPAACNSSPTGKTCERAAIKDLNAARAELGIPPYKLPSNFRSLTQVDQMFVLADLDRRHFREPLYYGVSTTLSKWAATYIPFAPQTDPGPQAYVDGVQVYSAGGNSAARFPNASWAYLAWMYNDGLGGPNIKCTSSDTSGCWGHRDNILRNFAVACTSGPCAGQSFYLADLSFGGAKGRNLSGDRSFDALVIGGPSLLPGTSYSYTWAQAVAAGA